MAVELATAYINLVPSARGIGASIAKEITGPLDAAALASGKRASATLGGSFLTGATSIAKKATLPFIGIGVAAVASAKSVEDAQNTIIRTTGATGESAEGLLKSFRKIAASTPASFGTVATTLAQVSQRTGLTGKRLEDLTLQVVTFNRITKDSPVGVQELTKALSSFNVPGAKMGTVLDRLFVTSQKTGVPLAELVSTLQTAGPVVRSFGLPIEQSAGLLATLNKAGVDAGPAIFGLRKAFTTFAKEGKDPKEALQAIVGQIQALTKAGDLAGARKIGVNLFGARGVGIVDAAVNGKLSLEALTRTFDSTGKGIRATASDTTTMSAKLGVLKNNAQLALAQLGGPLLEIATKGLKTIVPIVQNMANAFGKLPGPVQGVAVSLVALGAVAGPIAKLASGVTKIGKAAFTAGKHLVGATKSAVTFFTSGRASTLAKSLLEAGRSALKLGKNILVATANVVRQTAAFVAQKVAMVAAAAAQKILTAAQFLLNAAMTANPVGLIVAGIAALAAGIFIAYKKFKPFRDIVNAVGRALRTAFDWVKKNWPLILGILTGPFGLAILVIKKFGPQILSGIKTAFSAVVSLFMSLPGRIVSALATAGSVFLNLGKKFVDGLLAGAKVALTAYLAFYVKLPLKILSILAGAGKWLLGVGKQILAGLGKGVVQGAVAVFSFFARLELRVLTILANAASWLIDTGLKILRGLLNGITRGVVAVFSFFSGLPLVILSKIGNVAGLLFDTGRDILNGLLGGVKHVAGTLFDFFVGLPNTILHFIGDLSHILFDTGRQIIQGLIDGIRHMIGKLGEVVGGIGSHLPGFLKAPLGIDSPSKVFMVIGGNVMQGLVEGVAEQLPDLQKQLGVVNDTFTKAFDRRTLKIGADVDAADIRSRIRAAAVPVAPKLTLPADASTRFAASNQQFVYQQNAPVYAMSDFEKTVEQAAVKGMRNKTRKDGFVSGVRVSG